MPATTKITRPLVREKKRKTARSSSHKPGLYDLFNELADGICLSQDDGHILYLNGTAQRLLGITRKQALERPICELLCARLQNVGGEERATSCPLRDPRSSEASMTSDGRLGPQISFGWKEDDVHRIDRYTQVRIRCLRINDSWNPAKHCTIIQDISEETRSQKQKEDWRNMVAHDLRQPLTNLYGTMLVLIEADKKCGAPSPEAPLVAAGLRSATQMLDLLNLYLDLAKLDEGLMRVAADPVDLAELVRDCAAEQESIRSKKKILIHAEVPVGLGVKGDAEILRRVITNLLSNALKFTPEGKVIRILARRLGKDKTELSVSDQGIGIHKEDLRNIFDRYWQTRARREGRLHGTGLGLTFCREAVRAMKGEIEVSSKLGKGSVFSVTLPYAASAEAARRR